MTKSLAALVLFLAVQATPAADPIGRSDLMVHGPDGDYPSWIEIRKSGYASLVGSYVGRFGSVRPIGKVTVEGDHFSFAVPPQWEKGKDDIRIEAQFAGDTLKGTVSDVSGKPLAFEGKRAPALKREAEPKWGEPVELFDGKTLAGWKGRGGAAHGWQVRDGVLANVKPGFDLVSDKTFEDFKLVAEFRYPKGSNSGIYLRGRYEMQIEDNFGQEPESHKIGGIYGFLTPSINAAKKPGEWQTIEATLVGRTLTIILNGERVVDRQEIPGITGGALDSHEGEAGPLMVQGDHGPVEFRKITVTPAGR